MNDRLLDRFVRLIGVQTGISVRAADRALLAKKIRARMRALSLQDPERYWNLLQPQPSGTLSPERAREWQLFIPAIVTGESYLFRDRGQFDLLERELLPKAIAARRVAQSTSTKPTLKIWSAGCATGEELYSIAITLARILPDWESWDLQLVGTDINPQYIRSARQGIYGKWSFRQVPHEIRERYFRPVAGERWEILEHLHRLVRFERGNLLKDRFDAPIFWDCDAIVCRNVFIYFETAAIAAVLKTFKSRLRPGGYLICGHAELHGCDTSGLATIVFPTSVIYQRVRQQRANADPAIPTIASSPAQTTRALPVRQPATKAAPEATARKSPQVHEDTYREPAASAAPSRAALLASACDRADRGLLDLAESDARAAYECDPDATAPLALLAYIAEERGDRAAAKRYWRQVLYLEPQAIAAYLELAAISQHEGNFLAARRQQLAARELLETYPPDRAIDCGFGRPTLTAAQLLQNLASSLD